MKIRLLLVLLCLAGGVTTASAQISGAAGISRLSADPSPTAVDYGKLPLSFEPNQGQTDPQVKFLSRGAGYSLFLTNSAAVLTMSRPESSGTTRLVKTDTVRMKVGGARPGLQVSGVDKLPGEVNYFIGSDPAKWHANLPTYGKVKYAGVYPGVDLVYYGNQRQLEYDFVVAPGADPKPIRLTFAGAKRLAIKPDGDLTIAARNGDVTFHKPVIYQMKDGQRQPVEGRFRLTSRNNITFTLGNYDRQRELVIDPRLVYSTYLGGSGAAWSLGDQANSIAADDLGDAYVTGQSYSPDFPVTNRTFQQFNNGEKNISGVAFVTKINREGSALIYSTYLGGTGVACNSSINNFGTVIFPGDIGYGIALDAWGNAFITGVANSIDFPTTPGSFQPENNGYAKCAPNAFVTKLNAKGSGLIYSTYLGGAGTLVDNHESPYSTIVGDQANGIAVDERGNAYVAGSTASKDFPVTSNAFQTVNHEVPSAFVTKLNATGSALLYSTFLGGTVNINCLGAQANAIAVDDRGHAYVTGQTRAGDFPVTAGAFQMVNHAGCLSPAGMNAFVTKLDQAGSALIYSTFLGGSGFGAEANAIAIDKHGSAYVTGQSFSQDFPITRGAFQTTSENSVAFVTKFNPEGSALLFSTYLGGPQSAGVFGEADGTGIAVDFANDVYVTGYTPATDFPVTGDAFQKVNHGYGGLGIYNPNAFVTKLDRTGSALIYSTYLGGSAFLNFGDQASAIALDDCGVVYVTGYTGSLDFPITANAFQRENNGAGKPNDAMNAFVSRFEIGARHD
jgi:hypothetical protein